MKLAFVGLGSMNGTRSIAKRFAIQAELDVVSGFKAMVPTALSTDVTAM